MARNTARLLAAAVAITALCAAVSAQDQQGLVFSGYGKSGLLWTQVREQGKDDVVSEEVRLGSKDDAGSLQGRFRLDLDYVKGGMGIKTRVQWENWVDTKPDWSYAFAYGNFFSDQLTVSVGKLGSSPWGTGGPEMWKELETGSGGGMRTEIKPSGAPGLNFGFILNYFDDGRDQGAPKRDLTLMDILQESVLGFSYSHDLFLVRFAYRFDGEMDMIAGNTMARDGEDSLLYRVEERALGKLLPGFQIWALGYFRALFVEDKSCQLLQNWLFFQYDPKDFTAQVRFGLDVCDKRNVLHIRPSFYWKFFNNLLNVGVMAWYGQDFGEGKMYEGSPFQFVEVEPKIQFNMGGSSYIAFAYNWRREYLHEYEDSIKAGVEPVRQTQWMNLRFCMQL
jgi:hypothetical protein